MVLWNIWRVQCHVNVWLLQYIVAQVQKTDKRNISTKQLSPVKAYPCSWTSLFWFTFPAIKVHFHPLFSFPPLLAAADVHSAMKCTHLINRTPPPFALYETFIQICSLRNLRSSSLYKTYVLILPARGQSQEFTFIWCILQWCAVCSVVPITSIKSAFNGIFKTI